MRIIDFGYNEKGERVSLQELADEHYEQNKKRVIKRIEKKIAELSISGENQQLTSFLALIKQETEIKEILSGNRTVLISKIGKYKEYIDQLPKAKLSKIILKCFDYKNWRKEHGAEIVKKLPIRACAYCNHDFVLVRKKSGYRGTFDHFYSQNDYPYLSLSFFNLIPCCDHCNRFKNNRYSEYYPYEQSMDDLARFRTNTEGMINFILSGMTEKNDIKISFVEREKENQGFVKEFDNKIFHITDTYQNHKDIVQEIYLKAYLYSDTRKSELKNIRGGLFDDAILERLVVGNYTLRKDINMRPMSKFMRDIGKEAGLFRQIRGEFKHENSK